MIREINHSQTDNLEITCLKFSANYTTFIACGRDKIAKLYDYQTGEVLKEYKNKKPLNHVAYHPTLDLFACCGGQKAIDVAITGSSSKFACYFYHIIFQQMFGEVLTGHYSPLNVITFLPDGSGFVTGADEGNAKIFKFDSTFDSK